MRVIILSLIWIGFGLSSSYAQAGLQFYAGTSTGKNRSIEITPQDYSHTGYHLGLDARLNEGKMYFGLGMEYANIGFLANEKRNYFSVDKAMSWFKLRVGLGYKLIDSGKKTSIRAKTYGSINMLTKYPNDMPEAPYTKYNSGTAAAVFGLGMDIYGITLDFEYERGFFNAVHLVKETEFDFYKLSLGFKI